MLENLTVKWIAKQLGFYDQFHFSNSFKVYTGYSPTVYRKANLKSNGQPIDLTNVKPAVARKMLSRKDMVGNEGWLDLVPKLQDIAQAGLACTRDKNDRERYQQIRDICTELFAYKTDT